ncbi:MAG: hypothetical protein AN485_24145, partial [Anabaena sp. MDT14b]
MPRVYRQLVAVFDGLDNFINIAEIEAGVQPLCIHVQRQRHQIDIAGALPIAEQATLNTVPACQQAQFGGCDAAAPVIVRMQADDHMIARADMAAHPFNLIGIDVGHGGLNRRW